MIRKRWVLALAVGVVVVGVTATAAVGVTREWSGTVTDIVVKTSSDRWEDRWDRSYVDGEEGLVPIDGAEVTVTVDRPSTLIIDFAASSKCPSGRSKCGVRARVDGTNVQPGKPRFDSSLFRGATGNYGDQFAARSFRWAKPVEPGEHTVQFLWQDTSGGATFELQSWTLSVMTVEER